MQQLHIITTGLNQKHLQFTVNDEIFNDQFKINAYFYFEIVHFSNAEKCTLLKNQAYAITH